MTDIGLAALTTRPSVGPDRRAMNQGASRLSPTEHQLAILAAYVDAGTLAQTAHALGLAESTIKNSLGELYSRLEVGSAMEAAVRLGWVKLPPGLGLCRWVGVCTRPAGHRGHHGGFRGYQQAHGSRALRRTNGDGP